MENLENKEIVEETPAENDKPILEMPKNIIPTSHPNKCNRNNH